VQLTFNKEARRTRGTLLPPTNTD